MCSPEYYSKLDVNKLDVDNLRICILIVDDIGPILFFSLGDIITRVSMKARNI